MFGLKPTENRVSLEGGFPNPGGDPRTIHIMSCIGPMARTAEDLALLYRIIAGPDVRDTDLQPVPVEDVPALDAKELRIAYAPTFPGFPVAAEIREAVEALAKKLGDAGAIVEEARLPALDFHADLQAGGALIGMMLGAAQPDKDAPPPTLADYFAALANATARSSPGRISCRNGTRCSVRCRWRRPSRIASPARRSRSTGATRTTGWSAPTVRCSTIAATRRSPCRAGWTARGCRSACSWSAGAGRNRGCWRSHKHYRR